MTVGDLVAGERAPTPLTVATVLQKIDALDRRFETFVSACGEVGEAIAKMRELVAANVADEPTPVAEEG